jgi:hypothetical protein
MIKVITSLKELPYNLYTGILLKSKDDIKPEDTGYLYVSSIPPIMTILFIEHIEEISGKIVKETANNV